MTTNYARVLGFSLTACSACLHAREQRSSIVFIFKHFALSSCLLVCWQTVCGQQRVRNRGGQRENSNVQRKPRAPCQATPAFSVFELPTALPGSTLELDSLLRATHVERMATCTQARADTPSCPCASITGCMLTLRQHANAPMQLPGRRPKGREDGAE